MTLLQLHGLVPEGTQMVPSIAAHNILDCGPLSALVSTLSSAADFNELPPEELAKWTMLHHDILAAYCAKETVLPAAFGSAFSGEAALKSKITADQEHYLALLTRLQDIHEFTLRLNIVGTPNSAVPTTACGRQFLARKRDKRNQRAQLQQDRNSMARAILERLQSHVTQIQPVPSTKQDRLIDCAVLVKSCNLDQLKQLAHDFHEPANDLGLDCVIAGPWPLYSYDGLRPTLTARPDATGA